MLSTITPFCVSGERYCYYMNNNLIPQARADKNGKIVTRHVRNGEVATNNALRGVPPTINKAPAEVTEIIPVPKNQVATIDPQKVELIIKKLEKANKRLTRAGMDNFKWNITYRDREVGDDLGSFGGLFATENVADIDIEYPEIKSPTHSFVGSMTAEEEGMITRMSSDTDLGEWRPRESYCDHCGTTRRRNATYIVRDRENGEFTQVGSSCMEGYLGVDPANLFSLSYNPIEPSYLASAGNFRPQEWKCDVRKSLALALVISNDGKAYKSRNDWFQGIPEHRSEDDLSTYSNVLSGLRTVSDDHTDSPWIAARQKEAEKRLNSGEIDKFINDVMQSPDKNEYMENLRVLLSGPDCRIRNLGSVVSAVTVYNRMYNELPKEAQLNEWLGAEGDKIADVKASVLSVTQTAENAWGKSNTVLKMVTESGHKITWFASNPPTLAKGNKVEISAATIKKHDEWQGKKDTIITRAKMTVVDTDD